MKSPVTFPLTVSKGSVSVKIYHHESEGYHEYKVAYYKGGVRKMNTFADLAEAKAQADKVIEDILKGEESTLLLKGAQKSAYERAMGFSRRLNIPIDLSAERYAQLVEKLGPVPPMDAAEYYQRRHPLNMPNKTVREVVDAMLSAKAKDGASAVYLRDLRFRLGEFAEAFRWFNPSRWLHYFNKLPQKCGGFSLGQQLGEFIFRRVHSFGLSFSLTIGRGLHSSVVQPRE